MLPQNNPRPPNWFFKFWGMVFLLVIFGPFVFPFLWKSKTISKSWKIILTLVFTVATVWLTFASIDVVKAQLEEFRQAGLMR